MSDYIISCCSSCDLDRTIMQERDLSFINFHVLVDETTYPDDMGLSLPSEKLFQMMIDGAQTKTSQPSMGEFLEYFESFLREGKDVIHVSLSSGISGAYNSACAARDELKEKYPDRKLYVVDSLAASSGYGLIMTAMADRRDEGMSLEDLHVWVEDHKLNLHHWFFSTDLTFYIRGGRITKVEGFVGQLLKICPLLNVDYKGRLTPREKMPGRKKAIRRAVQKMKEFAQDRENYSGACYISHSMIDEDTALTARLIEEAFPKLKDGKVQIFPIGATIGAHTDPGTIAVFFWGDKRNN